MCTKTELRGRRIPKPPFPFSPLPFPPPYTVLAQRGIQEIQAGADRRRG